MTYGTVSHMKVNAGTTVWKLNTSLSPELFILSMFLMIPQGNMVLQSPTFMALDCHILNRKMIINLFFPPE